MSPAEPGQQNSVEEMTQDHHIAETGLAEHQQPASFVAPHGPEPRPRVFRVPISPAIAIKALEKALVDEVPVRVRIAPPADDGCEAGAADEPAHIHIAPVPKRKDGVAERNWQVFLALAPLATDRVRREQLGLGGNVAADTLYSFLCLAALPAADAAGMRPRASGIDDERSTSADGRMASAWERMDERYGRRHGDWILAYYANPATPPPTLDELARAAGQTRQNIQIHISRGIDALWRLLPERLLLPDAAVVEVREAYALQALQASRRQRQGRSQSKHLAERWHDEARREPLVQAQAAATAAAAAAREAAHRRNQPSGVALQQAPGGQMG